MKRCPNGTRKNKKTGLCEPRMAEPQVPLAEPQVQVPTKRCPKGSRKNKKTGLCEPHAMSEKKLKSVITKNATPNNKMILQFHSKSALLSGSAQSGNFVSLKGIINKYVV